MPTYSYRCTECGTAFDIQQAFTDDSLTECPNCGGRLRKLYGSVGVTFNGSGFYRTDSRASVKPDKGSSESNGSGSTDSAGTKGASESKGSGSSGSGSSGSGSGSSGSGSSGSGSSGSGSPSAPSRSTTKDS